jgi:hypothetical protein
MYSQGVTAALFTAKAPLIFSLRQRTLPGASRQDASLPTNRDRLRLALHNAGATAVIGRLARLRWSCGAASVSRVGRCMKNQERSGRRRAWLSAGRLRPYKGNGTARPAFAKASARRGPPLQTAQGRGTRKNKITARGTQPGVAVLRDCCVTLHLLRSTISAKIWARDSRR